MGRAGVMHVQRGCCMCMGMRVARYGWRGRLQHGGRVCDLFGVVAERARVHVGGLWGVEVEVGVGATRGGGQACLLVCLGVAVLAMCVAGVVRVSERESFIGLASGVPCVWGAVGVWGGRGPGRALTRDSRAGGRRAGVGISGQDCGPERGVGCGVRVGARMRRGERGEAEAEQDGRHAHSKICIHSFLSSIKS